MIGPDCLSGVSNLEDTAVTIRTISPYATVWSSCNLTVWRETDHLGRAGSWGQQHLSAANVVPGLPGLPGN
jgi:hypothetical protein